jgi:hypothetical protein
MTRKKEKNLVCCVHVGREEEVRQAQEHKVKQHSVRSGAAGCSRFHSTKLDIVSGAGSSGWKTFRNKFKKVRGQNSTSPNVSRKGKLFSLLMLYLSLYLSRVSLLFFPPSYIIIHGSLSLSIQNFFRKDGKSEQRRLSWKWLSNCWKSSRVRK